jgi:hypothetical protein
MPEHSDLAVAPKTKLDYDHAIHCGENRLCAKKKIQWPIAYKCPPNGFSYGGALLELSMAGCIIETSQPFLGDVQESIEMRSELMDRHLLFGGAVKAIYDAHRVGIRFNPMSPTKKTGLELLISELC